MGNHKRHTVRGITSLEEGTPVPAGGTLVPGRGVSQSQPGLYFIYSSGYPSPGRAGGVLNVSQFHRKRWYLALHDAVGRIEAGQTSVSESQLS